MKLLKDKYYCDNCCPNDLEAETIKCSVCSKSNDSSSEDHLRGIIDNMAIDKAHLEDTIFELEETIRNQAEQIGRLTILKELT